jgi:MFS family permease
MLTSRRAGKLTDSFGAAPVLGLSLTAFALAMGFVALAPGPVPFMAATFVAGLAYGGVNPPTNVVIAGRLARRLGFFLSVKQSGVPLGGLAAGVVLPPVAVAFGWRYAFAIAVGACLAVAASSLLLRNAAVLPEADGSAERAPMRRRQLLAISAFGFIMSGTQWTFLTYLTLYLTQEHGFSLTLAGLALALAQGLGAIGRLVWGFLSDAHGRRLHVLLAMSSVVLVSLALLAAGPSGTAIWPLTAVGGFAIVGWNGAYYALLAERVGPGRVGRASGDALFFIFGGSVALPPLLGLLADATGSWRPLWAVAGGAVALAGAILWAGLRAPASVEATVPAST